MDDFMKSLQGLNTSDLSALGVTPPTPRQEDVGEKSRKAARRRGKQTAPASSAPQPHAEYPIPDRPAPLATANLTSLATATKSVDVTSVTPPASPTSPEITPVPVPAASTDTKSAPTPSMPPARQRPIHEWPPIGAVLQADYFGTVYQAEVVAANKLLKSGKQLNLLDGPARGKRFDSFSRAMLAATAHQRKTMRLDRRGMSSGWTFWKAVTTSTAPASKTSPSPTSKSVR